MRFTDEQEKAVLLKNRNLLVSASAGTGKTAVLTERIMELLLDKDTPSDIDEMVIVTFTRAAASEMRERIESKLNERLHEGADCEHIKKQIALLPHSQITTIDSLCLNIIREYFYTIDIDPAFRIGDEQEIKLLAQDVLSELLEDKYTERSKSFVNMVETLAPKKDDSIINEYVLKLFYNAESHPWPDEWLNECRKAYNIEDIEALDSALWIKESGIIPHTKAIISDAVSKLDRAEKKCRNAQGYEVLYDFIVKEKEELSLLLDNGSYSGFYNGIQEYIFERFPTIRKNMDKLEIKDYIKDLRDSAKAAIVKLKKDYYCKSPEIICEELSACKSTVNELIDITLLFRERFLEEKKELNVLDFNDIEHNALKIICNEDGYAVNELRDSFRYILVDEYQDINEVQETIISALSRQSRGEPNVFMVGDVKQSIYQFRLARPEIFENKRKSYTDADSDYQRIMLKRNFRSSKAILGTVNYIFSNIMKRELGNVEFDQMHEFEYDTPKEQSGYGEPAEVIYVSEGDTDITEYGRRKLEAALIAKRIKELTDKTHGLKINDSETGEERVVRYDDIVILLRSMTGWAEEFTEMISAMQIPVVADEHTGYFSAREIRIAVSMLKLIDNPHQDIELASVLRSVFGNFTDEELAVIRAHSRKCDMYTAVCRMADESEKPEYNELSYKCRFFVDKLCMLREKAPYVRVHELIDMIYELDDFALHMEAMPLGERRLGNLRMLVDQAIAFEGTDKRSLFDFLRYIDKMRKADVDFGEADIGAAANGAVRIMSIHKSKGLEFPVAFVSGLGKQMNLTDARKNVIIQSDLGVGMDYFELTTRTRYKTLIKKAFARKIVNDSFGEELRILYVAFTRPKNKLILTGVVKDADEHILQHTHDRLTYSEMISEKTTYFDWLTPCFLKHPSWIEGSSFTGSYVPKMDFRVVRAEELIYEETDRYMDMHRIKEQILAAGAYKNDEADVKTDIDSIISYRYPYENETNLCVKVSVSDIKHQKAVSEDEAVHASWSQTEKPEYVPSFAKKEEEHTAGAARGTLYHTLMEHISVNDIHSEQDVKDLISILIDKGVLPEEVIKSRIISAKKILGFCNSPIGKRMGEAQKKGMCYKEQPFVMGLPACEVYTDTKSKEIIIVQGIIDAFFIEEDGIILLDYKTDKVMCGEEHVLIERYSPQMECYKKAIEKVYELPVKEIILYSFALDKEIKL